MTETKDKQFDALLKTVLDIMPRRDEDFADHAEWFAKELFDRGVVVLPCKVGDRLFRRSGEEYAVYELEIRYLYILESNVSIFARPILPNGEMGRSYECFRGGVTSDISYSSHVKKPKLH